MQWTNDETHLQLTALIRVLQVIDVGTNVRSFWAEGYEGSVYHEYHDDAHSMYFHHCCRCVNCNNVLDSRLIELKEIIHCYRCGKKVRSW